MFREQAGMSDFQAVFDRLKQIYQGVPGAVVVKDEPGDYTLNTPYSAKYRKEVFLGAVQIKKNYVSFHLFPIYVFPELLDGISPELKKHMQGKACFNFKTVDETLFGELAALATVGIERFRKGEML
jgi:hypothetical protein